MQREECEELFNRHKLVVDEIISHLCRRNSWYQDECDDFRSEVYLKLVESDCARMSSFRGGSSFETFLSVVIANLARDHRNKLWGKWRPSVRAKSLGELAVFLERLLYRDGVSLDEACSIIESATRGEFSHAQVAALAQKLKPRVRPQKTTEQGLEAVAGGEPADGRLTREEAAEALEYTKRCLQDALTQLEAEEALIIRMRFFDGINVASIGRMLGLESKSLYERFNRLVKRLGQLLEELCPDVTGLPDFVQ